MGHRLRLMSWIRSMTYEVLNTSSIDLAALESVGVG